MLANQDEKEKERQRYLLDLQSRIASLSEAIPKQVKVRGSEEVMYVVKGILKAMAEDIEQANKKIEKEQEIFK